MALKQLVSLKDKIRYIWLSCSPNLIEMLAGILLLVILFMVM